MATHKQCIAVCALVALMGCTVEEVVRPDVTDVSGTSSAADAVDRVDVAGVFEVADVADAKEASLAPVADRITDSVIKADREYLASVQLRLQQLVDGKWDTDDYHFCKAQAWLDMATNEYSENDRSGVIRAAVDESLQLIMAMEQSDYDIPNSTNIIETSSRVRPDLWEFIDSHRAAWKGNDCASCELATLEVQLVWVGHEQNELGWRHALPANQAADRMRRLVENFGECAAPAPVPVVAPTPAPVVPEPVEPEPEPDARLPHFVHFGSDSSALAPASLPRITAIAKVLSEHPDIAIRIEGYADVRGSELYNLRLAKRRAESVREALVNYGVESEQLSVVGIGEKLPRAPGDDPVDYARNRRVELVVLNADAPVRLDLAEVDLQPEAD